MKIEIREPGHEPEIVDGYAGYLQSDHWKRVRMFVMLTLRVCEGCGSKEKLTLHHKTYARLGNEAAEDLVCLCWTCHKSRHGGRNELKAEKSILMCMSPHIRILDMGPAEQITVIGQPEKARQKHTVKLLKQLRGKSGSPRKFVLGLQDVAEAAGVKAHVVRYHRVKVGDLVAVSEFVVGMRLIGKGEK